MSLVATSLMWTVTRPCQSGCSSQESGARSGVARRRSLCLAPLDLGAAYVLGQLLEVVSEDQALALGTGRVGH